MVPMPWIIAASVVVVLVVALVALWAKNYKRWDPTRSWSSRTHVRW